MLDPDAKHQAEWFQVQALQCIGLAFRAKDPRVKRLYTSEAKRWLHLAELRADKDMRDSSLGEAYRGVERRMTPRHMGPSAGVMILLEADSLVECTVRDFSPAGVGLLPPAAIILPPEFDLVFNHATYQCVTVWRQPDRMGLKFNSASPTAL
jgi:hypothetical protein